MLESPNVFTHFQAFFYFRKKKTISRGYIFASLFQHSITLSIIQSVSISREKKFGNVLAICKMIHLGAMLWHNFNSNLSLMKKMMLGRVIYFLVSSLVLKKFSFPNLRWASPNILDLPLLLPKQKETEGERDESRDTNSWVNSFYKKLKGHVS